MAIIHCDGFSYGNSYLTMMARLSQNRFSGQFHNEIIAETFDYWLLIIGY
jgi:hypothetical protein